MWSCPHCGNTDGLLFGDTNIQGMLCAGPDCGRFDESTDVVYGPMPQPDYSEQSLV